MARTKKTYIYEYITLFLFSFSLHCQEIHAPISHGELIDKISILMIKAEKISDQEKLHNINKELNFLRDILNNICKNKPLAIETINNLLTQLKTVNQKLWDIEDEIRAKERVKLFDEDFITLARKVYITNDERCAIKRTINLLLDSEIIEEKSYQDY